MSEPLTLALIFSINLVVGFGLGALFYAGLWWTPNRVIIDSWSPLWFIVSYIVRMAIVITGFYLLAAPEWQNLLLCLFGFMLARLLFVKRLPRTATNDPQMPQTRDSHHAS